MDISEDELRQIIGQRLASIRNYRGMNQDALAGKIGLSRTFIHMLEHGTIGLNLYRLLAIAEVLDVDFTWFVNPKPTAIVLPPPPFSSR